MYNKVFVHQVLQKINSNMVLVGLGLLTMVCSLVFNFLALKNNVIYSDEGWYLCLLRDLPHYGGSRFYLLFHDVFNNNIYAIRVVGWLLRFMGCCILALGLYSLIPNHKRGKKGFTRFLIVLSTLYYGQLFIVDCPSFNYILLNSVAVEFGFGFLFLGFSHPNKSVPYFALSAFFISFLLPIMITNSVIIPIMLLAIAFLSENKVKGLLSFLFGVLLFVLYYFVFVETPFEVLNFITAESKNVIDRGTAEYGAIFYVKWVLSSIAYLTKCFIIGASVYGCVFFYKKGNVNGKSLLLLLVVICLLVYGWTCVPPVYGFPERLYGSYYWQNDLCWILLFFLLISMAVEKRTLSRTETSVLLLLAITPIFLVLGSNRSLYVRQNEYVFFLGPILAYIVMMKKCSTISRLGLIGLVSLNLLLFIPEVTGRNWGGQKFFGEHTSVRTLGIDQNIKIDKRSVKELQAFMGKVPQGEEVLVDASNWWVVALLDYKPLSYEFDISRRDQQSLGELVGDCAAERDHLWIVGSKYNIEFVERMACLDGYNMTVDTIESNVYYYLDLEND